MSDTPEPDAEHGTEPDAETVAGDDTVTIHRAPRYLRFMIAGAVVGLVVALILTFSFPEPPGFDFSQVFGFLALFCGVGGFALGAVVALVVDRSSRRAAKTIVVERVEGGDPLDEAADPSGEAADQRGAQRTVTDRAATDRAIADRAVADRAATDRAATDHAVVHDTVEQAPLTEISRSEPNQH